MRSHQSLGPRTRIRDTDPYAHIQRTKPSGARRTRQGKPTKKEEETRRDVRKKEEDD